MSKTTIFNSIPSGLAYVITALVVFVVGIVTTRKEARRGR